MTGSTRKPTLQTQFSLPNRRTRGIVNFSQKVSLQLEIQ